MFWELRLLDSLEASEPIFPFEQYRIVWDEAGQRFVCDQIEAESCSSQSEANEGYESRQALVDSGYDFLDMDF